jgi:serine protease Do
MSKKITLVGGGLAVLALVLFAIPSRSATPKSQTESDRLQQRLEETQRKLDALQSDRLYAQVWAALERARKVSEPALRQYESVIQQLESLPEQDSDDTLSVLVEEGPSWLGVETNEVTSDVVKELKLPAERGVVIRNVTPDSPAAKAGLKENDVISEVNGQRVEGTTQFRRMIHEIPSGRSVTLTVWRDGRSQTVGVTLGKAEERHQEWMRTAPGAFAFHMPEVQIPEIPSIDLGGDFTIFAGGRARLGIDAEEIGGQLGSFFGAPDGEGILVRSVNAGSPAEKAGMKAGDVITAVGGERVRTVGDLREKLAKVEDKPVQIGVLRNKKEMTLNVELPKRPSKSVHKISRRTFI